MLSNLSKYVVRCSGVWDSSDPREKTSRRLCSALDGFLQNHICKLFSSAAMMCLPAQCNGTFASYSFHSINVESGSKGASKGWEQHSTSFKNLHSLSRRTVAVLNATYILILLPEGNTKTGAANQPAKI